METTLTIMGWFYVLTGVWPLIHMRSFEMITGEKKDKWLVKTVALMITCSGVVFLLHAKSEAAFHLALFNALTLVMIDVWYVVRKVIRRVYLLDAAVEIIFVITLLVQK